MNLEGRLTSRKLVYFSWLSVWISILDNLNLKLYIILQALVRTWDFQMLFYRFRSSYSSVSCPFSPSAITCLHAILSQQPFSHRSAINSQKMFRYVAAFLLRFTFDIYCKCKILPVLHPSFFTSMFFKRWSLLNHHIHSILRILL